MEDQIFGGDPIKYTLLTFNIMKKITCAVFYVIFNLLLLFTKQKFVTTSTTNLAPGQDFKSDYMAILL